MNRNAPLSGLAATVFAALFTASLAAAHEGGGPGGPWRHGGPGFEQKLDQLGLSAEQKTKVHGILESAKKDREANFTKMREASENLRSLLEQDSPDRAAVDRQVEEVGQMRTQAQKEMLHTLLAVRAELTPDQRAKLKEMRAEHGGGWHHGRQRGSGHRPDQGDGSDAGGAGSGEKE